MRLSPEAIVKEYKHREQSFGARDLLYDIYLSYYEGQQRKGNSLPVLAMNSAGRPLLRQVGESMDQQKRYSSRRLAPVIDDFAAMMGQNPTIRTELPSPDEQGQKKAEKQTKYLLSTSELSDMGRQQPNAGFFLSCLGDVVYLAHPLAEELRVAWEVVNPRFCYPSFWSGYRRFQLYDLIVGYQMTKDDIERHFEVTPESEDPQDCTFLTYVSQWQRTLIVGMRQPVVVADVNWNLGHCPAVWAFNKIVGRQFASSDIAHSLDQQDFSDFIANVMADGISYTTYPIIGIKNPTGVGEIVTGPGAPPVSLSQDGDIVVREIQGDTQTLLNLLQNTIQDMNATTGSSQVRQEGTMHSSIVTGRAVQAVQGPQSTRIELKQQILSSAIQELNEITFRMQEKAPRLREATIDIVGRYRGDPFRDTFDSTADIDGWYRTQVSWDQLVGMSLQQKVATAYEGMMAEIWDDVRAMELTGEEDPLAMRKRIQTMKEERARAEMAMQQEGAGPPAPPGPQVKVAKSGMPEMPNPGGHQAPMQLPGTTGQNPGTATPNLIFHPTAMRQGPSGIGRGGVPMGVTLTAVRHALFDIVPRLKGKVYAVGQLAWQSSTEKPELLITDHRDYTLVKKTVEQIAPNVKVRALDQRKKEENQMPIGATFLAGAAEVA